MLNKINLRSENSPLLFSFDRKLIHSLFVWVIRFIKWFYFFSLVQLLPTLFGNRLPKNRLMPLISFLLGIEIIQSIIIT